MQPEVAALVMGSAEKDKSGLFRFVPKTPYGTRVALFDSTSTTTSIAQAVVTLPDDRETGSRAHSWSYMNARLEREVTGFIVSWYVTSSSRIDIVAATITQMHVSQELNDERVRSMLQSTLTEACIYIGWCQRCAMQTMDKF